jgi:pyridoxal phosphate enzyme (YggS family)
MTDHLDAVDAGLVRRLAGVRERIASAAASAGRDVAEITLVAVTKTHPAEVARSAVAAGLQDLGENRVDELVVKSAALAARWHLVGRLQRNKVRDVVGRAHLVHSVDRRGLMEVIGRRAELAGVEQDILIQVNVGEDPAKGGCRLTELPELVSYAADLTGVRVTGLMTVPPLPGTAEDPSAAARPFFRALREARDALQAEHPAVKELSMGMSDDLEAAVQEGATMVRIGSALFGSRPEVTR